MGQMRDTLWISAGELSGDMHGAALIRAMRAKRPGLAFTGMGGPLMVAEEGFSRLFRTEELSVMGVTEVIRRLPGIVRLLSRTERALAEKKPLAVIVVDAPSFHFRVIKTARRLGIPVYYYISPKVWAWKERRALFLKENVRRLISILPFEVAFYKRFGMDIDYVGNPLVDMVNWEQIRNIPPVRGKIGLFPGSRDSEITSLMPEFGKAAGILMEKLPHLRFHTVRAPGIAGEKLLDLWPSGVPLSVEPPENRYAFMRECEMLLAASGTVTLEAALAQTPTLVAYKVSPVTYALGRAVVAVPYVSLSNLILGKPLFPELLQKNCRGEHLAAKALEWLAPNDGGRPLDAVRSELAELRIRMGEPGAVHRAAGVILDDIDMFLQQKQT